MTRRTSNLVLLASRIDEARKLLAEAGFFPLREEVVGQDKIRLYFRETEPAECLRIFNAVPHDMHAYRMM